MFDTCLPLALHQHVAYAEPQPKDDSHGLQPAYRPVSLGAPRAAPERVGDVGLVDQHPHVSAVESLPKIATKRTQSIVGDVADAVLKAGVQPHDLHILRALHAKNPAT